jgi:hypothetical protein
MAYKYNPIISTPAFNLERINSLALSADRPSNAERTCAESSSVYTSSNISRTSLFVIVFGSLARKLAIIIGSRLLR